jgi:uncharacterized protein (DUF952 family)
MKLFHITTKQEADAAAAAGEYTPAAFAREGFIHTSYARQVLATANRIFRGKRDLVVLEIDPGLLGCKVIDENLEGGSELFPHIYGKLRWSAVRSVHMLPCDDAGTFPASPLPWLEPRT